MPIPGVYILLICYAELKHIHLQPLQMYTLQKIMSVECRSPNVRSDYTHAINPYIFIRSCNLSALCCELPSFEFWVHNNWTNSAWAQDVYCLACTLIAFGCTCIAVLEKCSSFEYTRLSSWVQANLEGTLLWLQSSDILKYWDIAAYFYVVLLLVGILYKNRIYLCT